MSKLRKPKPNEVWGVPDKPETWRKIAYVDTDANVYDYWEFEAIGVEWCSFSEWPTDYVRIFPKDTP